jgi:hypothetical protein
MAYKNLHTKVAPQNTLKQFVMRLAPILHIYNSARISAITE